MKTCILFVVAFCAMACGSKSTVATSENTPAETENNAEVSEAKPIQVVELLPNDSGDAYTLRSTSVYGSVLEIVLTYSGGCKEHEFNLMTTGAIMKSMPPQMEIMLYHKGNEDFCRALVTDTVRFDLGAIKPEGSGSLILRLQHYNDRIVYNY